MCNSWNTWFIFVWVMRKVRHSSTYETLTFRWNNRPQLYEYHPIHSEKDIVNILHKIRYKMRKKKTRRDLLYIHRDFSYFNQHWNLKSLCYTWIQWLLCWKSNLNAPFCQERCDIVRDWEKDKVGREWRSKSDKMKENTKKVRPYWEGGVEREAASDSMNKIEWKNTLLGLREER